MRRPDFSDNNIRRMYSEYTQMLSPTEKKILNSALAAGVAYPTLAGTVDMFSGPENITNSNEYLSNGTLTALVPGAAAAGLGYSTMKLANPEGYARSQVYGDPSLNGAITPDSERAAVSKYASKYGASAGSSRLNSDIKKHAVRRRNSSAAFGAALGAVAGGAAAANQMMDTHPPISQNISQQELQELLTLLEANGAV